MKRTTLMMLLAFVLALVACGAEDPTATPAATATTSAVVEPTAEATTTSEATATAELAPTEVMTPTEVVETPTTEAAVEPTAEPTATTEPTPTVEPTPEVETVDESGVQFSYSPDLGITNVQVAKTPAQLLGVDGAPFYFTDVPEFIRITFDTPQGPGLMYVRPVRDESGQFFSTQTPELIQYFTEFEEQLTLEGEGRLDQQQLAYLKFGGEGKGLRAVSYLYDEPGIFKITNERLYYFFDGFTGDGRYYINLEYPISTALLEDSGEFTPEELAEVSLDFDGYITTTLSPLNEVTVSDFDPDLALVDALVQSLTIDPSASTEVSVLANDPNCVNDSDYVRDVTIPDATIINPGDSFQKVWEVVNIGSCTWTSAYTAIFVDPEVGTNMGWTGFVKVEQVRPGETFQIAVDLVAPLEPGIYEGRWQMVNESLEPFGIKVYVTIVVPEEPITVTPTPEVTEAETPTPTP